MNSYCKICGEEERHCTCGSPFADNRLVGTLSEQDIIREEIAVLAGEYAFNKPYKDLTSYELNSAGNWARMLMLKLNSLDVVRKVDRELPNDCIYRPPKQEKAYCDGRDTVTKAGYVAVEPLIESNPTAR